jgi:predicted RNA-binding Zn ribbon-like protein
METEIRSTPPLRPQGYELIASALCLDFANTLGGLRGAQTREYIPTYMDLAQWAAHSGLLDKADVAQLIEDATQHPAEAAEVHSRALALREAINAIFTAVMIHAAPAADDLALLNAELADTSTSERLMWTGRAFTWDMPVEPQGLSRMLGPIARSAAELLTAPELAHVGICASATCGWLFLDQTKNHRRRYCSPASCGNLAKVRRYRERNRGRRH